MHNRHSSAWDYLQLLMLSAIFGVSFMLTRIAVRDISPLSVATGRLLLAAVLLLVLMWARGHRLPRGAKLWCLIFLSSLFGSTLPFALIT